MSAHRHTNRLLNEKSPYLLRHAHDPIDWFPWGDEAIEEAERLDLPIFLSIGYASCHWCHKMEHEVFQNEQIAVLMNETFINIKVDREELPEVDHLYMEFAQSMLAGGVGWPLHLVLTPDLFPFYAATYIPPTTRDGLIGMKELALQMKQIWQTDEKEKVSSQAEKIVEAFASQVDIVSEELPADEVIHDAAEMIFKMADPIFGGIAGSPKFPIGYQSTFLLRYSRKTKDGRALYYVKKALTMMYCGGVYDHLGGGFCRYSLDEMWLIPQFEKMLFDNAIHSYSYLELWQATRDPLYRTICEDSLKYLLQNLQHPEGGFYSSQDSDTENREGYYYTWTPTEVEAVLSQSEASLFNEYYGVTDVGNIGRRSVLHIQEPIQEFCKERGLDLPETQHTLNICCKQLLQAREKKSAPAVDDKILSSWNGLAIHTLAVAGRVLDEKIYLDAAVKAANFVKDKLWKNGRLLRCWRKGESSLEAIFHEYAYLIRACITLHETTGDASWLEWAIELTDIAEKSFKSEEGGFYQTHEETPHIVLHRCRFSDGAEPSGNGVHAENLIRLFQMTDEERYLEQAEDVFRAVAHHMEIYPVGFCYHLIAYQWYLNRVPTTFVVALNKQCDHREEIARLLYHDLFVPLSIVWVNPDDSLIMTLIPSVADLRPIDGQTTVYKLIDGEKVESANDLAKIIKLVQSI